MAGIHALASVKRLRDGVAERLTGMIVSQQEPGGTWPSADLFATLDALLALGTSEARAAVQAATVANVDETGSREDKQRA